ncbi:MAG: FtsW/RodA/SpoVE family cell cycle protein [Saccharofermentanales bacterium]
MPNRSSDNKSKLDIYFNVIDYWILIPVLIVSVIGLFVLNRVLSSGYEGNGQAMFMKQAGAVIVGILIAFIIGVLETPMLKLVAYAVYGISLLLLVAVFFDNYSLEMTWGADSWLKLPLIGTFQPSELAKIGIVMLSAYYFADIRSGKLPLIKGMAIILAIYGVPTALIMKQPDLGTVLIILFIMCCMFFVYGVLYRYIFLAASIAVAAIPLVWTTYLLPHQKNRILTFLYPGFSPSQAYHIEQAKLAIRSGGLTGTNSSISVSVPVKESDFIYTAVAEHLGMIGTTVLVFLIFFFIVRGLLLASRTEELSLKYMAAGIAVMFGIHSVENLGMCVGIMPITGIPLPFVSLGGSSMIVNYFALGILLCISIEYNMIHKAKSVEFLGDSL